MALLTASAVSKPRLTVAPVAVASTDTVAADTVPLWLVVINGNASSDVVTITDPGSTPAGSVATNPTASITNGTTGIIPLLPQYANSSGIITIAHSITATVTCYILRVA